MTVELIEETYNLLHNSVLFVTNDDYLQIMQCCTTSLVPELNDKSFLGEDVRRPGASAGRPAPPFSLQFTHCHTNSIETETTTTKNHRVSA